MATGDAAGRTGVLVLSAWMEPHGPPLRVRITERLDVYAADESSVTVAGAEVASTIVRDWLLRLESPSPAGEPGGSILRAETASSSNPRQREETT